MEKHSGIVQAEAFAVIVGLILMAMVLTIVIVLVIIYTTKQKMKARSQFTIHVARNFNDASRDKETPISDFDQQSLKNQGNDEAADFMTESLDNPLYHHTTSFTGTTTTYEVATSGFTNQSNEQDNSSSDVSVPISKENLPENDYEVPPHPVLIKSPVETGFVEDHEYEVPHDPFSAKPPVALPRGPAAQSPRRPPPMLPIIKPKVYANIPPTSNKPGKPPVSVKPQKQPVLPHLERPPTDAKPPVKPKPKALPRNM